MAKSLEQGILMCRVRRMVSDKKPLSKRGRGAWLYRFCPERALVLSFDNRP